MFCMGPYIPYKRCVIYCRICSKNLKKCLTCIKCTELRDWTSFIHSIPQKRSWTLTKSSKLVVKSFIGAEKYFPYFNTSVNIFNKNWKYLPGILEKNTLEILNADVLSYWGFHLFDDDLINGHSFQLVKLSLLN